MTFPLIRFELPQNIPNNFPQELDLSNEDPIAGEEYSELIRKAQEARVPYYSVAIVESKKPGDTSSYYHVYDMPHFGTHLANLRERQLPLTDPLSRENISKVHYFALKCFEEDPNELYRPVDHMKQDKLCFKSFFPCSNQLFQDALNPNIQERGTNDDKEKMRRIQVVIVMTMGNIMTDSDPEELEKEKLLWLWCAAKTYKRAALMLANSCLATHSLADYGRKLLEEVAQTPWDINKPRSERNAIQEAKNLLEKMEDKNNRNR